jgi:hypothetical protein
VGYFHVWTLRSELGVSRFGKNLMAYVLKQAADAAQAAEAKAQEAAGQMKKASRFCTCRPCASSAPNLSHT